MLILFINNVSGSRWTLRCYVFMYVHSWIDNYPVLIFTWKWNVYRKVLSYIEATLWEPGVWKIHSYQDKSEFRSDHSMESTYFYIKSFKSYPIRSVRCAVYNFKVIIKTNFKKKNFPDFFSNRIMKGYNIYNKTNLCCVHLSDVVVGHIL